MEIQDRILYLIELKGLNRNSFSKITGINPQTIHHIVTGRRTHPSFEVINKILSTFSDISSDWFILGIGEPNKNSNSKKTINSYEDSIKEENSLVQEAEKKYERGCLKCEEKERVISAQQNTINSLQEQVSDLRIDKQRLLDRLFRYEK